MAAKTVKMCDMSSAISTKVFEMLNPGKVEVLTLGVSKKIVTDVEPKDLTYPEGWYYAKGYFRNKHTNTTGLYDEVIMQKKDGSFWEDDARYCTLRD